MELATQKVRPHLKRYAEATETIVALNKSLVDYSGAAITNSVASARTGVLVGIGAAIVITLFVVGSITRPLAVAVGVLEHVAQGDLTHHGGGNVPRRGRPDARCTETHDG